MSQSWRRQWQGTMESSGVRGEENPTSVLGFSSRFLRSRIPRMLKNPQPVHLTLRGVNMRAQWISIPVDDQARALKFYTDRLGFIPKVDVPVGDDARWLTVVSPEDPDGVEVVLEPKGHPAAGDFTAALKSDGVPLDQYAVDDVLADGARRTALGVADTQQPKTLRPVTTAIMDDPVGNLIQPIRVDEATAQPAEARLSAGSGFSRPPALLTRAATLLRR